MLTTLFREDLIRALPYARRYARALTGSRARGDELVAEGLKEVMDHAPRFADARRAMYAAVTRRYEGDGAPIHGLTPVQRQLLLLTALEELPVEEAAPIVSLQIGQAAAELDEARARLREGAATDVLIIEDEPIIAMDIEELVESCGHRVVGVATSETEAIALAAERKPGLILADINLGSGGDGASAVFRITQLHHAPVIFVTAYPERLLTGGAHEPTFVITKPFEPLTLAVATYQAVTGGVRLE